MIDVHKLTTEQKKQIQGKEYAPDCFFNPIQDKDNNWIISKEEVENMQNEQFIWLIDLPLIPFTPKTINPFL